MAADNAHADEYLNTKLAAYRNYLIAATIPAGAVPRALYWDSAHPGHSVRVLRDMEDKNNEYLIIAGETHQAGSDQKDDFETYKSLERWGRERFPEMNEVIHRWPARIKEPSDGLPYIGKLPSPGNSNFYGAAGFSGNGISCGIIAGLLLSDMIQNRSNPWKALYDPARKARASAPEFLRENLNALPNHLNWLTPASIQAVHEISADS